MLAVEARLATHEEPLRRGAELGPNMSIAPTDYLSEIREDGSRREIMLLDKFPADFSRPKAHRTMIVNLSEDDFNELRKTADCCSSSGRLIRFSVFAWGATGHE